MGLNHPLGLFLTSMPLQWNPKCVESCLPINHLLLFPSIFYIFDRFSEFYCGLVICDSAFVLWRILAFCSLYYKLSTSSLLSRRHYSRLPSFLLSKDNFSALKLYIPENFSAQHWTRHIRLLTFSNLMNFRDLKASNFNEYWLALPKYLTDCQEFSPLAVFKQEWIIPYILTTFT